MRDLDYSCYAGSSAFLSTPSDLVRFAMALDSGKLLKPETVQLLQTSQRLPAGEETGYGLGWDLETVTVAGRQTRWIGHDGDFSQWTCRQQRGRRDCRSVDRHTRAGSAIPLRAAAIHMRETA